MNDTVKWILAVFVTAVAFYAGSEALGFNWITFQASILAFVRMIGTLLLLFTGSAAAIEVARYYHRRNEEIDREHTETGTVTHELPEAEEKLTRSELESMLRRAVSEAVHSSDTAERLEHMTASEEKSAHDHSRSARDRP